MAKDKDKEKFEKWLYQQGWEGGIEGVINYLRATQEYYIPAYETEDQAVVEVLGKVIVEMEKRLRKSKKFSKQLL